MQTEDRFDVQTAPTTNGRAADPAMLAWDISRIMFNALSLRVIRILTLVMAFVLFTRATWTTPSPWNIVAASAFAVCVALPLWLRGEK